MPCPAPFVALSGIQVAAICFATVAAMVLVWLNGVDEGREREACEPRKKVADDDGETLGASSRRDH